MAELVMTFDVSAWLTASSWAYASLAQPILRTETQVGALAIGRATCQSPGAPPVQLLQKTAAPPVELLPDDGLPDDGLSDDDLPDDGAQPAEGEDVAEDD